MVNESSNTKCNTNMAFINDTAIEIFHVHIVWKLLISKNNIITNVWISARI